MSKWEEITYEVFDTIVGDIPPDTEAHTAYGVDFTWTLSDREIRRDQPDIDASKFWQRLIEPAPMTDINDKVVEDREQDARIAVALENSTKDESGLFFTIPLKEDRCAKGTYWRNSRSGASLHTAPEYTKSFSQAGLTITSKEGIDFGSYVTIEQKRFGVENEQYVHKVVGLRKSNTWVDVPVRAPTTNTHHDHMETVVAAICCGIDETQVLKYRLVDVKPCRHGFPSSPEGN